MGDMSQKGAHFRRVHTILVQASPTMVGWLFLAGVKTTCWYPLQQHLKS